jgi:glycosyltransferase involved in cell wall biosynthesis
MPETLRNRHETGASTRNEPKFMLKVLHVTASLEQGGAERMLHSLASASNTGVTHRIVVMQDLTFFDFSDHDVASLDFDLSNRARSLAHLPSAMFALRRLVASEKPDIVQGWLYYGNLLTSAASGLDAPIVWSIHNTTLAPWRAKPALRAVDRTLALGSRWLPSAIIYCARSARTLHESQGYRANIGVVIPNGVNGASFRRDAGRRAETRQRLAFLDSDIAVGLVGRYDPQKDIPTSLRAFARFADGRGTARLVLAGRGMEAGNAELSSLIADEGLAGKVILLGAVGDVESLIGAMDIVMLGSRYGEALPMTLLEALFCEVPIVATMGGDVGLLPIPAQALARSGDPGALAGALGHVWDGEASVWRAGFAKVREDYSLDRSVAAYCDLYRRIAAVGSGVRQKRPGA